MNSKSQIATEFMLMVGLAMIVIFAFLAVIYVLISDYYEEKNMSKLEDLGYSIQSELILAAEVEPGYERTIIIPDDVGGVGYSLSQAANDLVITYRSHEFLFAIPQVSGALAKGSNTIRKTDAHTIVIS
ncbi:MAG TPA: hypothetical protein VJ461_02920 [Candidatus Nanoarchaeia archaeon]|nr:hypothetical protein [Candidatus Nanoarchaeia archaeon]